MFTPVECFIGLRYLGSGRRKGFVSFVSFASMAGIGLGVAAVLVILSVMNGLELEFRTRLLAMTEHVDVMAAGGGYPDDLRALIEADPAVISVMPFTEIEAMLAVGSNLRPTLVRGLDPDALDARDPLIEVIGTDSLQLLAPESRRILLGRFVALGLGVDVGDFVRVARARVEAGRPQLEQTAFEVAGIFSAGVAEYDSGLALISLADAGRMLGLGPAARSVGIRLDDPESAPGYQRRLAAALGDDYSFSNWADENSSLFNAMAIEKAMMTIILMFIVGVAAFNIVASLMMVVSEKQSDIAILRTFGIEASRVVRIFVFQGLMLGAIGVVIGTALGLVLALNVETIVPWLEQTFDFRIMPGDVFYVTEIPSDLRWPDAVIVPLLAFAMTLLATVYPSRRAARIQPADALRET